MSQREKTAENLILHSGQATSNDQILIIPDQATADIGAFLHEYCLEQGLQSTLEPINALDIHGQEPAENIAEKMLNSSLIICLTQFSMAHTQARKAATSAGVRYMSLPDYDWSVFDSATLQVDFQQQRALANELTTRLNQATKVHITTELGTDIHFNINQRAANNCDAVLDQPGSLGSPPDIEVNVAPLEMSTHGKLVVDGSIPHPKLGLLQQPFTFQFEEETGLINVDSEDTEKLNTLLSFFEHYGDKAKIIGELGIGLNPLAKLCGRMLEDEGVLGSFHCGFGSNATIGGLNKIGFHLDFITLSPNIWLDGEQIFNQGKPLI